MVFPSQLNASSELETHQVDEFEKDFDAAIQSEKKWLLYLNAFISLPLENFDNFCSTYSRLFNLTSVS